MLSLCVGSCYGNGQESEGERMSWKVRPYYNVNPFIGGCLHDTMVPVPLPPFMIPGKLWHIDFSVVQGLWLGSFLSNGRDREIISDDLLFVGRMSDAGFVLPHISIPPSWYNLLTTLFGSSNALFGVGSIKLASKNLLWGNEDCDLATSPIPYAPISINLQCGDPFSLPTDVVVLWGTVYAGMSLSDIYAALIDLALQWAIEGFMFVGGKALNAGFKKIGSKIGKSSAKGAAKRGAKAAAKRAAKKAQKSALASVGDKLVSVIKKLSGATASDAYKEYLEKAAKVKGIKNVLGMSDDELATFVKKTGGYSDELADVTKKFTSGYDTYAKKYGKQVNVRQIVDESAQEALDEIDQIKKLDGIVDDNMAEFLVKNQTLKEALQSLDTAVGKVATEEVLWALQLKLATKSFSKFLNGQLIRQGNVFGSGTSGGVFSFSGLGWTDYFSKQLRFEDKWYASIVGYDDYDDQTADFQAAAGFDTETDDDYWYTSTNEEDADDADSTDSDDDDDDDDYWYGDAGTGA